MFVNHTEHSVKCQVGVDEVGRGCLAGPVVAAAVAYDGDVITINKHGRQITLKDSKKLSPASRTTFDKVIKELVPYGIGIVDVSLINDLNIHNASLLAMQRAINDLQTKCVVFNPSVIIVDGSFNIPGITIQQIAQPKADTSVPAVMMASIIAKVYRDNIMYNLHKYYPDYDWNSNKGYGTIKHINAIKKYGLTSEHRNYKKFLQRIGVTYET